MAWSVSLRRSGPGACQSDRLRTAPAIATDQQRSRAVPAAGVKMTLTVQLAPAPKRLPQKFKLEGAVPIAVPTPVRMIVCTPMLSLMLMDDLRGPAAVGLKVG